MDATAADATTGEPLVTGYAGRMLFTVSAGSMTFFAGQLVISPLLPTIIDALSITPASAGVALSVMWGLVAICRFPGGRLADRLSQKTVIVASFLVAMLGFAALAAAGTYAAFVLGAAAVGVGMGLYMPAAIALLSDVYVARRGRALGIHEIAINLGGVAAGGLAVAVLSTVGWNGAFVPVIAALAVALVFLHRWNDDPYVVERVDLDLRATGARLLGNPRALAALAAFGLLAFTWQGIANFLPAFLQADKGFDPTLASNAFTGLFAVGIVANLVVTPLGDRFGHVRTAAVAAALGAVGLGLLVAAGGLPGVLAGIALFGLGNASFWPLLTAFVMGLFPNASRGGDYGALSTAFMAVGSLGPTYVGVVAERASYTLAFAGLVGCAVASCGLAAWLAATGSR